MNLFPKTLLPALACMAMLACFQSCKEDKQETIPCPKCPDLDSECIEGSCQCKAGTYPINGHLWCAGRGQFLAVFDNWYCLDTLALRVGTEVYHQPTSQTLASWSNADQPDITNYFPMYIVNEPSEHYIISGGFIPTRAFTPGPTGFCDTLGRRYFLDFYGELVHPDTIIGHFIARTVDYVEGESMRRDTLIVPMYMLK